jgi:hypothetical protein
MGKEFKKDKYDNKLNKKETIMDFINYLNKE